MKRSKEAFEKGEEDFWIAAIGYMDNLFKENEFSISSWLKIINVL